MHGWTYTEFKTDIHTHAHTYVHRCVHIQSRRRSPTESKTDCGCCCRGLEKKHRLTLETMQHTHTRTSTNTCMRTHTNIYNLYLSWWPIIRDAAAGSATSLCDRGSWWSVAAALSFNAFLILCSVSSCYKKHNYRGWLHPSMCRLAANKSSLTFQRIQPMLFSSKYYCFVTSLHKSKR